MNRDDMIENAARAMAADTYATPDAWDVWVKNEGVRHDYRRQARAALEAAGTLPPERELEPLPIGTRKRSRDGVEAVLTEDGPDWRWMAYKGARPTWCTDKHVEHWDIIPDAPEAPKATIDADELAGDILRAMLDWSMSLGHTDPAVTERIRVGHREVIADAIRAALPDSAT